MAVKERCCFCRKYTRSDGTCQNKECVRYVPDKTEGMVDGDTNQAEVEGGTHTAD